MAEVLSVEVSSFFQESSEVGKRLVFPSSESMDVKLTDLPEGSINVKLLTPVDFNPKAEPYLIEIPPNKTVPSHFFIHKGEEVGYLISGRLQLKCDNSLHNLRAGDVVYLTNDIPSQWKNPGPGPAKMLWMKIK
jgi:quercetin dioxygenase-like cupin family protein